MGNMPALALTLTLLLVLGACGGGSAGAPRPAAPAATPSPGASPNASPAGPEATHVFVIVMENHSFAQAMAQPYTARLAATYAAATDYHAVSHPSLPNYLALSSGSTWGIHDDNYHSLPAGGLGTQLTQRGVSWRAYMEGMGGNCLSNGSGYAVKHNPFAYYGGGCPPNVVPMTALDGDLGGNTPRFAWITPDQCHDGHDCGARTADDFLSTLVPRILASRAWQQGGVLFITWDEDDGGGDNHVLTLVLSNRLAAHSSSQRRDHYSLLATVEDQLGVPRLGQAASADPLNELLH
jgi:acid phosphatase